VQAVDLMVVLQSFVPSGGAITRVTVYPSDFGLQKMAEVLQATNRIAITIVIMVITFIATFFRKSAWGPRKFSKKRGKRIRKGKWKSKRIKKKRTLMKAVRPIQPN
jgi:hypothetical protein